MSRSRSAKSSPPRLVPAHISVPYSAHTIFRVWLWSTTLRSPLISPCISVPRRLLPRVKLKDEEINVFGQMLMARCPDVYIASTQLYEKLMEPNPRTLQIEYVYNRVRR